ncbi:hypothetical protein KFE25_014337 [Diacronema lutheri]|uniref:Uncharacterized protein n=1 Tax=Diacronema lutheri TaxID=2081491 RepID=A0A8J6C404_DIALT|nr:hypothetical protein KFE25_014337 [Diacronema lutheri]
MDSAFLERTQNDTDLRRRTRFINEVKKHPAYKPGMLDPPKKPFKDVQIGKGPVVVTHEARKTGHEKKKAHDWGPLGGW